MSTQKVELITELLQHVEYGIVSLKTFFVPSSSEQEFVKQLNKVDNALKSLISTLAQKNENEIQIQTVPTIEPAIRIISNKDKLKNASDRDHSLEFMVAAGLLFKEVNSKTYEDNFSGLKQIENLRRKIKVQENKEFTENYYDISKRHIANTVYFEYNDGSFSKKETVETPIGHPNRREEAEPLLKQKFINNMSSHFSEERAKDIWEKILLIDVDSEFKEVIKLLSND